MKICSEEMPAYTSFSTEHQAACWLHHDMAPKVEPPARIGSSR
jgi:oligopeptide transport system ATP-binding protein